MLGAYVIELALRGYWSSVMLWASLATLLAARLHFAWRQRDTLPRRLVLTAQGDFHFITVGGGSEPAQLLPASMRIGGHLLLVLRSSRGVHRLLLGSDNLEASQLAALGRRLGEAGLVPGTTLNSSPRG